MKAVTYICMVGVILLCIAKVGATETWTDKEVNQIRNLWIGSLPSLPSSPTNAFADDPRAAALGQRLFFDKNLSDNGTVACSTCHNPDKAFTDGNALSEGRGTAPRNAPSIIGAAYHRSFFWDGRADSLWSQALGPLESAVEHGTNRILVAKTVYSNYRREYEAIFGAIQNFADETRFPNQRASLENPAVRAAWNAMRPVDQQATLKVFVNVGKSIEAYERRLMPGVTPFDRFAEGLLESGDAEAIRALSNEAQSGLKLFIGKAGCVTCHSGSLMTDDGFHNTGVPINKDLGRADAGRALGVLKLLKSGFNCLSSFSDAPKTCDSLLELQSTSKGFYPPVEGENTATLERDTVTIPDDLVDSSNNSASSTESPMLGKFKVPGLRNISLTGPYMHAGQYFNLRQVIQHYVTAPEAALGETELKPVPLQNQEIEQLIAFLKTLEAAPVAPK